METPLATGRPLEEAKLAPDTREDWRAEALNEALRAEAYGDNCEDALLREIRRVRPAGATLMMYVDRVQLRRFLDQDAAPVRRLTPGSDGFLGQGSEDEVVPYLGWLGAEWHGETFEVAFVPCAVRVGYVLFLAESEALLAGFAREMAAFVEWPAGRCLRYTHGWENAPDMDGEIGKVTWDDVVLPAETATRLRDAVEGFVRNRDAYAALGFAWRRGVLLVGPPGTGKTMICKAVAAALPDLPFLYVRDLQPYSHDDAVRTIFQRARQLAPCILAFEDLDGLVHEDNRTVFLNELDGFQNNEGLLIIASSNHPGRIDEALLKRPSRFDRVIHIGLPQFGERREFCLRLLARSSLRARLAPDFDADALARTVAERTDGFTPAYLKEAFVSAALERAQEGATTLDDGFARSVLAQVDELKAHLKRMDDPEALAEMTTGGGALGFRH
jgi:AAA+ superfamily predicted ATPase